MPTSIQARRDAWRAWSARHTRVARYTIYLLAILAASLVLRAIGVRGAVSALIPLCCIALVPLLLILLHRWILCRLLWTVRNRLIVTYIFMGLAPVVLFGTLSIVTAYLFAGQFETTEVQSSLDKALLGVRDETATEAAFSLHHRGSAPAEPHSTPGSHIAVAILNGGAWQPLIASSSNGAEQPSPFAGQPPPAWIKPGFRGIVVFNRQLYLCSEVSLPIASRDTLLLGSMPFDSQALTKMAEGLGTVTFGPSFAHVAADGKKISIGDSSNPNGVDVEVPEAEFDSVKGGRLPAMRHFFDWPVLFSAPLSVTAWDTGSPLSSSIVVISRPTALYERLFANAAGTGTAVRIALIVISIVFACIEFLALLMAFGLSRTITRSVADLSIGTRELDAGHLNHRIRVRRQDQLGALAGSFNRMAASISDLLIQQREKERLLSELQIAQEVQTTLLPQSPATVPGFEVHALCQPARTVGGDYFDFIFGPGPRVCIALGDISGKGIPAALLMASLHSAVRAFTLGLADGASPSPAQLLKLINHHLYASTQTARYATLFLACYDTETRKLTYSNGGHLPPLIISADGSVQRLECGGPVVGLLQNLDYYEETVQLKPGDLLMAFTDGLTEPENATEEEFGEQRLLQTVRAHSMQSLSSIAANTMHVLQQWIGNHEQPDDMTLLLAREL